MSVGIVWWSSRRIRAEYEETCTATPDQSQRRRMTPISWFIEPLYSYSALSTQCASIVIEEWKIIGLTMSKVGVEWKWVVQRHDGSDGMTQERTGFRFRYWRPSLEQQILDAGSRHLKINIPYIPYDSSRGGEVTFHRSGVRGTPVLRQLMITPRVESRW